MGRPRTTCRSVLLLSPGCWLAQRRHTPLFAGSSALSLGEPPTNPYHGPLPDSSSRNWWWLFLSVLCGGVRAGLLPGVGRSRPALSWALTERQEGGRKGGKGAVCGS
ncbi:unnamed protein product, partial [Heterosigma akashiwo]